MNISKLASRVAIDMHTHVHLSAAGSPEEDPYLAAAGTYFRTGPMRRTLAEIDAHYRERDMACVVFSVDTESADGRKPVAAEEIVEFAAAHDDVVIPFGSVDPWRGVVSVRRVHQLVELGAQGFKFHPSTQGFFPDDRQFYPIYEAMEACRVPVVFHTGQTGIGAGMRRGGGVRLKYSNPLLLDDVAVDFPDLTIIMAHPSVPWQDEGLAVALHKPNVYIDLSGWSPKYFEPKLVRYMSTRLQDKVLFGSDFPVIDPDRWLRDFDQLGVDDAARAKILKDNALRVLAGPEPDPAEAPGDRGEGHDG